MHPPGGAGGQGGEAVVGAGDFGAATRARLGEIGRSIEECHTLGWGEGTVGFPHALACFDGIRSSDNGLR